MILGHSAADGGKNSEDSDERRYIVEQGESRSKESDVQCFIQNLGHGSCMHGNPKFWGGELIQGIL